MLIRSFFRPAKTEADATKRKQWDSARVRDHLANERTYLAWMRTAIALLGFGILIVKFRMLQSSEAPSSGNGWRLGLVFSLTGLLMVLIATQHYFAVRRDIDENTYEPPDRWVILSSVAIMLLGIGVIYYVFTVPFNPLSGMTSE